MRPTLQAGMRTTAWANVPPPPGFTSSATSIRFRWKDGRPELAFVSAEWSALTKLPWDALPADAKIDLLGRSVAVLSRTTDLSQQVTIVAYYGLIWMGNAASPGPMSGMLTWST